jgi:hypothetical protein
LELKQATAGHFLGREEVYDTLEKILHQAVDNTLAQKTNDISYREAFDRVALLNIAQKQNPKLEVSSSSVGGIDLNVGQLPINETGNQNIVPWETPALNPAQWEQIKGLEPVFIRMQPINVSALLGLDNSPDPSGNLSYSMAVR